MDTSRFGPKESGGERLYLSGKDIEGRVVRVKIARTEVVHFERDQKDKLILHFVGAKKGMVLNPTNTGILQGAWGKDDDAWVGGEIEISTSPKRNPTTGETGPGLDVRPVQATYDPSGGQPDIHAPVYDAPPPPPPPPVPPTQPTANDPFAIPPEETPF